MVDLETLLDLRLTSLLLPAWPVMLYVALVSVFVLMRRIRLCLLTTYLFTFYWGISLHWGAFLSTGTYLTAFIVYTICGVAVAGLAIAASFSEPARDKRQSKEREKKGSSPLLVLNEATARGTCLTESTKGHVRLESFDDFGPKI